MTTRKRKTPARKKAAEEASQIETTLEEIQEELKSQSYLEDDLIPIGATMPNLAASGYATGGWKKGSINTMPGESDAGKTILAMSGLASAAANKNFDKYKIIMDNAEVKGSFDLNSMFPPLANRLVEPPGGFSKTIQQFGGNMLTLCK